MVRKNRFFLCLEKTNHFEKTEKSTHISKIKIPQYQENRTYTEGKSVRENQHLKDDNSEFAQKKTILFIEYVQLTQKFFCDI